MTGMNDFAAALAIPDIVLIKPQRHADARGFFSETFNAPRFAAATGTNAPFVQDNHSFSAVAGTVRGLHLQMAPSAQGKLVRVTRGAIWDVAVDVRQGSPHYGHYAAAELSADNWHQLWIPPGFLHGFCTLKAETEVVYKTTALYDRDTERGVLWNDPSLAIPWPVDAATAVLSDKDRALPPLASCSGWF
jgi:dTDP-4-dehydrorhamnose 3,5-epimerase